jgi:hypothetical protein
MPSHALRYHFTANNLYTPLRCVLDPLLPYLVSFVDKLTRIGWYQGVLHADRLHSQSSTATGTIKFHFSLCNVHVEHATIEWEASGPFHSFPLASLALRPTAPSMRTHSPAERMSEVLLSSYRERLRMFDVTCASGVKPSSTIIIFTFRAPSISPARKCCG